MRSTLFILLLAASSVAAPAASQLPLPVWAYPVAPPAPRGAAPPPADTSVKHLPGTTVTFTLDQTHNLFSVPDWFPDQHPPLPSIVSQGNKANGVGGCGYCHLPNGQGRPENASVAGLPAAYIIQQMSDFKNGLRKGSESKMPSVSNMIKIGKVATDDEVKEAAAYFSALRLKPWIRVIETERAPATTIKGGMLIATEGAPTEPIGQRVIEVSEDLERTELRDPTSGFIAYVPKGSLKRGADLVTTGASGTTIRCTICHGPDLKGLGNVPSIAGRSPSQMARQIIDIRNGVRNGPGAQLMKEAVSKLTADDIVAITGYLASRNP